MRYSHEMYKLLESLIFNLVQIQDASGSRNEETKEFYDFAWDTLATVKSLVDNSVYKEYFKTNLALNFVLKLAEK